MGIAFGSTHPTFPCFCTVYKGARHKKELIVRLHRSFEDAAHHQDGVEFWYARELQLLLGYAEWRNFALVVDKARIACVNAGQVAADHFVDVNKMVDIGSGTSREINDLALTRYACYLIAQNGDPRKDEIAFAMTYFAVAPEALPAAEDIRILRVLATASTDCDAARSAP